MKKVLTTLLALATSSLMIAGGGWPKKKGEGYFKLGQGLILGDHYYTPDGSVLGPDDGFAQINFYETYLYGEYGVTDRFTAIGYFPLFSRITLNSITDQNGNVLKEGDELSSIGDMSFSFKYGIIPNKKFVWSAQLNLKLPTGEDAGGESGTLQTGDGAFSQMLQTDVSTAFGSWYVSGMLGFRHRGADYSDDWHAGFEVGWNHKSKLYLILKVRSQQSLLNNEDTPAVDGVFSNNQSFVSYGPEVHYFFNNGWGVNATFFGAFMGENILASPYIGVGVSYDLKKKDT